MTENYLPIGSADQRDRIDVSRRRDDTRSPVRRP